MIQALHLGNSMFPNNIIQGPLAGISCAPFRMLTWKHGNPAFSNTEMISCKTILFQSDKTLKRYLAKDPAEGPVCFQLSSTSPKELAEAVKKVTACGADLIDLNCGCPVKKIRSRGAGSSLLSTPEHLASLIASMRENTQLPISIKIRVDGKSNDKFNHEIVKVVSESGLDFLTVHGRHWTEHYETPCQYDEIKFFVNHLKIPIIGNGDISCVESLKKMFSTGCAGVMIARAGVGQPWLVKKLIAEMNNEVFITPTLTEIGAMFIEHITQLSELLENAKFALLQGRKIAKYYARPMKNRADFCEKINNCNSLLDLKIICEQYFK